MASPFSLFSNLTYGFCIGFFKSHFVKFFVKRFLSDIVACDGKKLTVNFIDCFTHGLFFISLVQFSKSSIVCCQFSPFRLRLSISTRTGFLLQGVTPAQQYTLSKFSPHTDCVYFQRKKSVRAFRNRPQGHSFSAFQVALGAC